MLVPVAGTWGILSYCDSGRVSARGDTVAHSMLVLVDAARLWTRYCGRECIVETRAKEATPEKPSAEKAADEKPLAQAPLGCSWRSDPNGPTLKDSAPKDVVPLLLTGN